MKTSIDKLITYVGDAIRARSPRAERYYTHLKLAHQNKQISFAEWQSEASDLSAEYQQLVLAVEKDFADLEDYEGLDHKFKSWSAAWKQHPPGILGSSAALLVWVSDQAATKAVSAVAAVGTYLPRNPFT